MKPIFDASHSNSMSDYPSLKIIMGLGLNSQEEHLLAFTFGENLVKESIENLKTILEAVQKKYKAKEIIYLPFSSIEELEEKIPSLHSLSPPLPLFLAISKKCIEKYGAKIIHSKMLDLGILAIWEIPQPSEMILLPELSMGKEPTRFAYVMEEDKHCIHIYKQLFLHAGYEMYFDFPDAKKLYRTLQESLEKALEKTVEKSIEQKKIPHCIQINLDHPNLDLSELFYYLEVFSTQLHKSHIEKKCTFIFIKDFNKPGLALHQLQSLVRPFANKISTREEALTDFIKHPSLASHLQNPRVQLLFKWLSDIQKENIPLGLRLNGFL